MSTADSVTVHLLADRAELLEAVAELRWREWGKPPEPTDRSWWLRTTTVEAGRDRLPVTWVAVDEQECPVGAVGLGEFDIAARRDRSPWVLGMIVTPDRRARGIGRWLLGELEAWASRQRYQQVWVATAGPAVDFYRRCGWELYEEGVQSDWETATVLRRERSARGPLPA